jgi:hypothetical protein
MYPNVRLSALVVALAALPGVALAQTFTLTLQTSHGVVLPGDSATISVYGSWAGITPGPNGSAVAGFSLDVLASGAPASLSIASAATVNAPLADFGVATGSPSGADLLGVMGVQFPGIIDPVLDPSNPILLFTFQVHAFGLGTLTYTAGPAGALGDALTVYTDAFSGAFLPAPSSAQPEYHFGSVSLLVVPAPAGLGILGLGVLPWRRRR